MVWFSLHRPFSRRLWAPPETQTANVPVAADGDLGHSQGNRDADGLGANTQPSQMVSPHFLEPQTCQQTTPAPSQPSYTDVPTEKRSAPALPPQTRAWEPGLSSVTTNTVVPPARSIAALPHPLLSQGGAQRASSMGSEAWLQPPIRPGTECRLPGS